MLQVLLYKRIKQSNSHLITNSNLDCDFLSLFRDKKEVNLTMKEN